MVKNSPHGRLLIDVVHVLLSLRNTSTSNFDISRVTFFNR